MKKGFNFKKVLRRKNILLASVSLLLVAVTGVTATASWIEDVSQVEFSTNDDSQQTPAHIGNKILNSDAVMSNTPDTVNLTDFFNKSGDMHLSPCYGDGENFYFPVEIGTNEVTGYRIGTKDDANVNYLSATFRVQSAGADTAYWFEKSGQNHDTDYVTFKDKAIVTATDPTTYEPTDYSTVTNSSTLAQYIRCSITVDGVTNVYALNDTGKFYTVSGQTPIETDGRRLNDFTYYTEQFDSNKRSLASNSSFANQGAGSNLNGNTLFTVNKYDSSNKNTVKTVTVKLWLEYNPDHSTDAADLSAINLNIVSSWAKTRRVFVKDMTVHQEGYDNAKWLPTYSSTLWFGLKDDLDTHWQLTSCGDSEYYYADIPAIYNNADVVFVRCNKDGWGKGDDDKTYTSNGKTIKYWNKWETTFPNTFHSETYKVYSTDFATWEPEAKVNSVYVVNSTDFNNLYDYMWDSNSVINSDDINAKVVKNANWPGLEMTTLMKAKTLSQSLKTYGFFYNSKYDRIIFNDGDFNVGVNQEYQTQDLYLTDSSGSPLSIVGGTFDMATLTWFHTNPTKTDWNTKMPSYSASNTYIHGNFSTNNKWKNTRFAYGGEYGSTTGDDFNGSTSTHMLCKIYCKAGDDYEFKLCYNGVWYGADKDADKRVTPNQNYYIDDKPDEDNEWTLIPTYCDVSSSDNDHQENFIVKGINAGDILRIYFDTVDKKLYLAKGENTHY